MALPRSTLAQWVGVCGVQLQPLVDALKEEILTHAVLDADETPVAMLHPGHKKTHRAYLWAYAPGAFEDLKAVVYDFCEGRACAHASAFLGGVERRVGILRTCSRVCQRSVPVRSPNCCRSAATTTERQSRPPWVV